MEKFDLLDRRIMYELDLNARLPASRLAKMLKKSKETINFRLNKLVRTGLVKGFYAVFNTSKLGWYYQKFYLKFKDTTPGKQAEIISFIRKNPVTAYLAATEGFYDCVVLIAARSPKNIEDFLHPLMKSFGEFIHTKDSTTFLTVHRYNQRFLYRGEARKDWHYRKELENYRLDDADRKILAELTRNSRSAIAEIARKTNIAAKTVRYRMTKLEKDEIIISYVTSPNFEKLGLEFYQINISVTNPGKTMEMLEYFNNTNACLFGMEMVGRFDLAVELHLQNSEELRKIMEGFKEKFTGVYNDYNTLTITREYEAHFFAQ